MANIIQFTGLSGAGKTTLANQVKEELSLDGYRVAVIDGDVYRRALCKDLGFSRADRIENIRRLGTVAGEMSDYYDVIIISAINPYQEARDLLKQQYQALLVHIDCDIITLRLRDTKGLYKRAFLPNEHEDKIYNLTGVNDVFDYPEFPDFRLDTNNIDIALSVQLLKKYILSAVL